MAWLPVNVLLVTVAVGTVLIREPTADTVARQGAARVAGTADGLVVGERQVAGGQGRLNAEEFDIVDPAAGAPAEAG